MIGSKRAFRIRLLNGLDLSKALSTSPIPRSATCYRDCPHFHHHWWAAGPWSLLGLSSAYMVQWVPALRSPENERNFNNSRTCLERVLQIDPANKPALSSLGNLAYFSAATLNEDDGSRAKKLEEAHTLYQRLSEVDPGNKNAFYMQAVLDWSSEFPDVQRARQESGLQPGVPGPIPDPAVREGLRNAHWSSIADGIDQLKRALDLDPDDSDSMSYMNLLLRDRAALRETPEEAAADQAEAERWVQKSIESRKRQAPPESPSPISPTRLQALPPPDKPASGPAEVAIGARVAEADLIRKVEPVYSASAQAVGIHGVVRFTAHIDADGKVSALDLVSGHPLLVNAAREAVMLWEYRPVLLNGQPVAVRTDVVVEFAAPAH